MLFTISEGVAGPFAPPFSRPQLRSSGVNDPFAALSGLAADASDSSILYAVPDNALVSTIYRIHVTSSRADISKLMNVTLNGAQAKYDLEGIAIDTSISAPQNRGFWLAPFEKVEGLTLARGNTLYLCLDNEGGAVESRFLRTSLPGERFELGFTGPDSVTLGPTEPAHASSFATLSHSGYGAGAQAWSISVAADNAEITSIGIDGTDAEAALDGSGGFVCNEVVSGGAVSAVVLSFVDSRALAPEAVSTIASIELDIPAPPPVAPVTPVVLRYEDGLRGSGKPVLNDVIEDETHHTPDLTTLEIEKILRTGVQFIRGDASGNGHVELVDAIRIFGYLFRGNPSSLTCLDSADANDTEEIDISDGIYILRFLFIGGTAMPSPFPDCGFDLGVGALTCESFEACD